jgi:hypothetical protein
MSARFSPPTPLFSRYIGIDYSGAKTPTSSLSGLRVYMASHDRSPVEVRPPRSRLKYWTRRGIAEWLLERLGEDERSIIGIDHGFAFPLRYLEQHRLPRDWSVFLDDFHRHWPTDGDDVTVDDVREGRVGRGAQRAGDRRWKRLTEVRAGAAKSVFHFDVQGSVAKSTHAGLPWLRLLRQRWPSRVHAWPFDGWRPTSSRSVIAEVYPSLWSREAPSGRRTPDQHDAWSVAAWLRRTDLAGRLPEWFEPGLSPEERSIAQVEGWILGVRGA